MKTALFKEKNFKVNKCVRFAQASQTGSATLLSGTGMKSICTYSLFFMWPIGSIQCISCSQLCNLYCTLCDRQSHALCPGRCATPRCPLWWFVQFLCAANIQDIVHGQITLTDKFQMEHCNFPIWSCLVLVTSDYTHLFHLLSVIQSNPNFRVTRAIKKTIRTNLLCSELQLLSTLPQIQERLYQIQPSFLRSCTLPQSLTWSATEWVSWPQEF